METITPSHPLKCTAADLTSRIHRLYGKENPLLMQQVYELILGTLQAFCGDKAAADAGGSFKAGVK